jgi:integrase
MSDKPHHRDRPLPPGYPQQIEVEIDGERYRMGWHKRSGKYRFRIQRNHRQQTAWFGPDPAQAKADAELDIPRILKGEPAIVAEPLQEEPKPRNRNDRPATIGVTAFNRKYVLRLNSRKQYRCKVQSEYINCTGDPNQAPHIFKEKLLTRLFPDNSSTGEVTLESAIDEWMGIQEISVGEKRLRSYRSQQNVICETAGRFTSIPLNCWTQLDWRRLRDKLAKRHSPRTLKGDAYFLRSVLERANKKYGIVTIEGEEVFKRIQCYDDERIKHFSADEIKALLAIVDKQWKSLILFAVNGAFEPGDLAHLEWRDIDRDPGWYEGKRRKTGKWRRFRLWPETITALNDFRTRSQGHVFATARGSQWKVDENNKSSMGSAFREFMERAGVYQPKRNLYGCRHTFGHYGMKMQGNYQFSQDAVLGHTTKDTSRIYQGRIDDPYIDGRCEFVRLSIFEDEKAAFEYNARWLKEPAGLRFIEAALANARADSSGAA